MKKVDRLLRGAGPGRALVVGLACLLGWGGLSAVTAAEDDGAQRAAAKLRALRPDIPIDAVEPSPVPGLYELALGDGSTFYATADGRYLFSGDLYELGDEIVNVNERKRSKRRAALLAGIDPADTLRFEPEGQTKAVINVFTDVDCGYCRKLHLEVPQLNAMGIEVHYLAYPRAGIGSESYKKIVSAWCADDPNEALTRLKAGGNVPTATCTNPVASQYELGRKVGISGTPAIVLEDGRLLPGYMPAEELARTIGI